MSDRIRDIRAEEIQDSRGRPTLRVTVATDGGAGRFDVPSGASTGEHEAHELRDAAGGMTLAIKAIEEVIAPALSGAAAGSQKIIDDTLLELDGTPSKMKLGGNTLIGVSIATARAAAQASGVPLYEHLRSLANIRPSRKAPYLFVNLINGGKHAHGGSPFQEHQILPDTDDVGEALDIVAKVYERLGALIRARGVEPDEGDEGGYVFPVSSVTESFELLVQAVEETRLSERVHIGADIAASSFYENGAYNVFGEDKNAAQMADTYRDLVQKMGLKHIEDPFAEESFQDFSTFAAEDPSVMLIGDDLTTTNPARIRRAGEVRSITGVIIKPNQIGTLTETLDAMREARELGIECIVSHRSGETMDDFVGELAYAFSTYGLKAGAPHRPERRVKYERLLSLTKSA